MGVWGFERFFGFEWLGSFLVKAAGAVSVCGEGFCRPLRRLVRRSSKGGG